MFEYDKNPNNSSGGSITSNSFVTTGSYPKVKKVTVTEYVYDKDGNIVKETCTETEYEDTPYYQPYTYPYTYTTASSSFVPGEPGDTPLK